VDAGNRTVDLALHLVASALATDATAQPTAAHAASTRPLSSHRMADGTRRKEQPA